MTKVQIIKLWCLYNMYMFIHTLKYYATTRNDDMIKFTATWIGLIETLAVLLMMVYRYIPALAGIGRFYVK